MNMSNAQVRRRFADRRKTREVRRKHPRDPLSDHREQRRHASGQFATRDPDRQQDHIRRRRLHRRANIDVDTGTSARRTRPRPHLRLRSTR